MRSANEVDQVRMPFCLSFCVPDHAYNNLFVTDVHRLSHFIYETNRTIKLLGKFGILFQVDQIYCSSTDAWSQNMAADQFRLYQ